MLCSVSPAWIRYEPGLADGLPPSIGRNAGEKSSAPTAGPVVPSSSPLTTSDRIVWPFCTRCRILPLASLTSVWFLLLSLVSTTPIRLPLTSYWYVVWPGSSAVLVPDRVASR